jgi:hypothetical protein
MRAYQPDDWISTVSMSKEAAEKLAGSRTPVYVRTEADLLEADDSTRVQNREAG